MTRCWILLSLFCAVVAARPLYGADQASAFPELAEKYDGQILPALKRFCLDCHSSDKSEGELDLERFRNLNAVRRDPKVWEKVVEMLDNGEMPPEGSRQLSAEERKELRDWTQRYLDTEALASAGDPGPVVLRRLTNSEYNNTVRDLTGVRTLDPTHEFPVDGAAGEGFINSGNAQGMSPSLVQKYLDAAKQVASHAVLLPKGIEFSEHTSRRDQTDELVSRIQEFYRPFTKSGEEGGRLDVVPYVAASLHERQAIMAGQKTLEQVAAERKLNAVYLTRLWLAMTAKETPSWLLNMIRDKWSKANADDAEKLSEEIAAWQQTLWKFNSIGHIGRAGGPPSWQEPVNPIVSQQEFRIPLPPGEKDDVVVHLSTSLAPSASSKSYIVWQNARIEAAGEPTISARHTAGLKLKVGELRRALRENLPAYLAAAENADEDTDVAALAQDHGLHAGLLAAWLDYLAIGPPGPVEVRGHYSEKLTNPTYGFIQGWGTHETPSVIANSSDQEVRIPGIARPHSIMAHPSPTLYSAMGWKSPIDGVVEITSRVADAHPECGNGVEWIVRHETGNRITDLWKGDFEIAGQATMPAREVRVRKGELIAFILGPRHQTHACDLTSIDLTITELADDGRRWDLAEDVSSDLQAANPHPDRLGNQNVWHFYRGEMNSLQEGGEQRFSLPAGSLLESWQKARDPARRRALAERVDQLVGRDPPPDATSPDGQLYQQIHNFSMSPDLFANGEELASDPRFGKHPAGQSVAESDLVTIASQVSEIRVPAEFAEGREFVVTARVEGNPGGIQVAAKLAPPGNRELTPGMPFLSPEGDGRETLIAALSDFRELFPAALCYDRIVPVDEVVTLTLFYREDEPLRRLMLHDEQIAALDRLWDRLYFVSQEPLAYYVAFEQIREFATQDRPDLAKEWAVLVEKETARMERFKQRLLETEPTHLRASIQFAAHAWRRPLREEEASALSELYREMRDAGLTHEAAIQLTLARILTSPAFLYKREKSEPGTASHPVTNYELATRLSYFLWSSTPDESLRAAADAGQLASNHKLREEARRMLSDQKTRRLAIQFACQWLHLRDFDQNDDKNEKLFPEFATIRRDMYEETVLFFEDMFRQDGPVTDLLTAKHTFLNERLAEFYGIDGVEGGHWRRVDNVQEYGRGGILGMSTFLASQSGASRTSPILRGNWISETLLGERLPRPPANVPQLPEEVPSGLTARQLIEQHSSVAACAKCHARIDPYGFALEQFDPLGRTRGELQDTSTQLVDGTSLEGIGGLREYLSRDRGQDVLRQFCRKLLGFALGRETQLSDRPLIDSMMDELERKDYRFSAAVDVIVQSPQFRMIRGRDASN